MSPDVLLDFDVPIYLLLRFLIRDIRFSQNANAKINDEIANTAPNAMRATDGSDGSALGDSKTNAMVARITPTNDHRRTDFNDIFSPRNVAA
jgi:hypothetical protein